MSFTQTVGVYIFYIFGRSALVVLLRLVGDFIFIFLEFIFVDFLGFQIPTLKLRNFYSLVLMFPPMSSSFKSFAAAT